MAEVIKAPTLEEHKSADAKADKEAENSMREFFAAQPKVSIKTRETEWVQVNGYTFIIQAGQRVDVPAEVAAILEESGRI